MAAHAGEQAVLVHQATVVARAVQHAAVSVAKQGSESTFPDP